MNTQNETVRQVGFWAAIIIGIVAVVAGMIWLVSIQNKPVPAGDVTIENVIAADDWVKGNRDAKVTLIEYGDFQCPACAYFSPLLKQLSAELGNDLAVVFRHYPLPQHKNAPPMMYAADAAGLQGKFWEMNELIYANQRLWQEESDVKSTITEYAKTLGLNTDQFLKDFESKDLRGKADKKVSEAVKLNVVAFTPSFFLNGKRITPPTSYAEFKAVVSEAISAGKTASTTVNTTNANTSN